MRDAGKWDGFWEQPPYGRQAMEDLLLEFDSGSVRGAGRDMIGPFLFEGTYDTAGLVRLRKQYIGRHTVLYVGQYDGEGVVFGQWFIGSDSGKFALRRQWRPPGADAPIQEIGR